jgi:alkylation response protein AidB-like acyl-CoA dehydrogenase
VHFAFSDDQVAFRDAVADFLAKECPPSVVRATWDSRGTRPTGLWEPLAEMGVIGLTVPESAGGLGLGPLDLVLLLEETGRAALPEPVVETTAVCAPLVDDDWAARIASGAAVVVLHQDGDYTPWVDRAALVLVATADGADGPDGAGAAAGATAASPDDLTITAQPHVDAARPLFSVTGAAGVPVADAAAVAAARDRGALGVAAQLCGLTRAMIDMTVEYVKERRQFGVPVGSYQAVKHHLANALLRLEYARPVVYRAAHSVARSDPLAPVHVSMAKVYAADAAGFTAKVSLQCHGAIGYTLEHDLHLFLKRAWALTSAYGGPRWHRNRVAAHVLG